MEIDASITTMLVSGDPSYEAHDGYKEVFGSDEVLSIAIPFANSLSPESLDNQRRIVEALEELAGVVEVDALVTQDDSLGEGDELSVEPLVPGNVREFPADSDFFEQLRLRIQSHPIWPGWLVSESMGAVAIQVRLDDSKEAEKRRGATMAEIEAVLSSNLPGAEYFLAGHPFMKSEIARSIASDLARLLPVAFLVMTLLLLVATRSFFVGLSTSFAVLLSVIWMVGAMGWLGLGMTALTNTAPTILVALATACFLHLAAAFQSEPAEGSEERSRRAFMLVRRPMWIAAATTALGYASLCLSSVPIVREFGLTLSVGVISTAIVGTFFLPQILASAPESSRRVAFAEGFGLGAALVWVSRFVGRSWPSILVFGCAVAGLMGLVATQIQVDSSGPKRFDEDSRFRVSSRFYRSQLSGDVLESVYLSGSSGDFLDPELLRKLQVFQSATLELPAVDKVVSIADYVARIYWVFRGEVGDPNLLPESAKAVSQLLLLYESSGDLGDLEDFINSERSMVRVMLKADVQSSSESAQLKADLNAIAWRLFPGHVSEHSVVSTEMLLSQAADVISVEQVKSALLALAMILFLISASFMSLRAGGLMLLPNLLPLTMNLGLMAILGITLSDATSIISATAIGIAVDSTVHLLSSAMDAESQSGSKKASVVHALVRTGRPVVVTSLVVVLGFLFLLLSEFGSVAELGMLTAATMVYCLLADLFILPSQLFASARGEVEDDVYFLGYAGRTIVASGYREGGRLILTGLCEDVGPSLDRERIESISSLDRSVLELDGLPSIELSHLRVA